MAEKIIGVVSGKGGVGKTVSAVNLALALHQFGEDVVVVDADTSASNLGMHLGINSCPNNLYEVLMGHTSVDKSIYLHSTGLKILPSAIDLKSLDANVSKLRSVLKSIPNKYVIVDAPPGLDAVSRTILDACDEILLVTNPEMPIVTNAVKVARVAQELDKTMLGVLVNRTQGVLWELTPKEIELMCELSIVGIIPEDANIKKSIYNKYPVLVQSPYSKSSIAYKELAAKLLGGTYNPPKFVGIKRFLGLC